MTDSRTDRAILRVNGVDLCVETVGNPADPALLLLAGATASMDAWDHEFCLGLARGPRFVIRYDSRDTGQSTSYEAGAPPYTGLDLTDDALGLLDHFSLTRAHLVGISMGGGIVQRIAVEHPDRVASLTLISTTPGGPQGPHQAELPPPSEELQALFANPTPAPDWSDRSSVIEYLIDGERHFAGPGLDETQSRHAAARTYDRTTNIAASMTNHWLLDGVKPLRARLPEITAPALVIHGTEDPLFPFAHARALATEIPGARLLPLEHVGHQMPPRQVWDTTISAILAHTGRS
ncbi:alpha/beta hydrolase [Actinoplanes sp. NPDC026623]|uniref:alpha/beta fold hydrolase n=1 Tax=Actinoplanes sp. NPDC026623 TaxID=3155610 RepID=UPI0033ED11E1